MKFLTIRQPWASLIAVGAKTIETRPFSTTYRGPLAIHAGKAEAWRQGGRVGSWAVYRSDRNRPARMYDDGRPFGALGPDGVTLPLGAVVAVCDLVDVVPITASAVDGERRIVNIEAPLPGGTGKVARLWDDDGRGGWAIDDQLPFGDFTPGRYAWLLENVRAVEPVPMKGAQGLRDVPAEVVEALAVSL